MESSQITHLHIGFMDRLNLNLICDYLSSRIVIRRILILIYILAISSLLYEWMNISSTYVIASWLFIKLFAFTYFIAITTYWYQAKGLIYSHGLTPIPPTLSNYSEYTKYKLDRKQKKENSPNKKRVENLKLQQFLDFPTVFWYSSSDRFIHFVFFLGTLSSVLTLIGIGSAPICLAIMYISYLSLMHVSSPWLNLQWDVLLLESNFLCWLLTLSSHGILNFWHVFPSQVYNPCKFALFPVWWLSFRLMFSSGLVKLTSGDKNWKNLKAMNFHYESQPIPTTFSPFLHHLPEWMHKLETLGTLVIECGLPFLLFGTFWMKCLASLAFFGLNLMITITGNYGYFNLLYCILSVLVVQDKFFGNYINPYWNLADQFQNHPHIILFPEAEETNFQFTILKFSDLLYLGVCIMLMWLSLIPLSRSFRAHAIQIPGQLKKIYHEMVQPFYLINSYGLFAIMTYDRQEIIIEGSNDKEHWIPYEFKYKPGNVFRRLPFIPGYMPRLDWQMWFCVFHSFPNIPEWFFRLIECILSNNSDVLNLLQSPLPFKTSPKYLRVELYDYRLATPRQIWTENQWWIRNYVKPYIPVMFEVEEERKI